LDPGKWSTDKLSSETQFVLGVNVNKALGHAANRGKVYILHPELFKVILIIASNMINYVIKHFPWMVICNEVVMTSRIILY
jgi:hypothetical protein